MLTPHRAYDAVVFDLLTALLNSWRLWNDIAGSEAKGLAWRQSYLALTYGAGAYRPYLDIVREAALSCSQSVDQAAILGRRFGTLEPWSETNAVVSALADRVPLGIATNCSAELGAIAARCAGGPFSAIVTAESCGFYKPRPEPYRAVLQAMGTAPGRTLFVAGSAADVPGARACGMPVFWHNRIGLASLDAVRPDFGADSLQPLLDMV